MLDRKAFMKIQIRAALEVVAGTLLLAVCCYLISVGLDALLTAYGFQGVLIGLGVVILGLFMNLVYQIRVGQLKFEENWKKTVDQ